MKTNRNIFLSIVFAICALISSCKKDEHGPHDDHDHSENEIITTVQIAFKDSASNAVLTYRWENLGGFGLGSTSTVDTIKLSPTRTYFATVLLLNKTNPADVDTISNEVMQLKNEHQFFYATTGANLTSSYLSTDVDANGVPLGLFPKFVTGIASKGNLEVVLKHQPNVKPKTGQGDKNQGSTDLNVTFPVEIK
ncbi:MAG: hypothetical protein RLZZ175_720 [Bacteroidota bacterium]|jgi:hypothetical protein